MRTSFPFLAVLFAVFLAAAPALQAQTTYRIDQGQSRIVYSMTHPMHSWTGTSQRVSGSVTVANGVVTGGRVSAPVQSFDSGNRNRDSHMAEATESYLYPDVVFEAQAVTVLPAAQQTAERNATVAGTLTFHGTARPVTVPVRIDVDGDQAHIKGQFEVTLTEFDIDPPSLMMIKTRDWVRLDLDLIARAS